MKANLPAIRYTTFIDAFQQAVAKQQEKIKSIEENQSIYNLAVEAVREFKGLNSGEVKLSEYGVTINIDALPSNKLQDFQDIAQLLHKKTIETGIRAASLNCPEHSFSGYSRNISWYFRIKAKTLSLSVDLPLNGISDIVIETNTVTHTYQDTVYVYHNKYNAAVVEQLINDTKGVKEWNGPQF